MTITSRLDDLRQPPFGEELRDRGGATWIVRHRFYHANRMLRESFERGSCLTSLGGFRGSPLANARREPNLQRRPATSDAR